MGLLEKYQVPGFIYILCKNDSLRTYYESSVMKRT